MNEVKRTVSVEMPLATYEAIEQLAQERGISTADLMASLAETQAKILSDSRAFFASGKREADMQAARDILSRPGGKPPQEGDELPDGWSAAE